MYTTFEQTKDGLLIKLNERGYDELEELKALHEEKGPIAMWWEINESMFCNGYSNVRPEQIGALTEAPIIADGIIDEETTQNELDNTKFWWFPDYMVRDEVLELLTKGEVFFPLIERDENT